MNQDGDVTVEAAGAMTLKANNDINIEGQSISIKGQLGVSIEAGTSATLKGNTGATVDGGLSATVQGTTISVNGMTSFSV
jgi:hypothetical protein